MNKLKISVLPLLVLLAACAQLGVPQADTFNKRIVVANSIVESTAVTIETLVVSGNLSKEDAQKAQDRAKDLAAGIDIARQVLASDPSAADAKLTAVIAGLNALNAYLETRK